MTEPRTTPDNLATSDDAADNLREQYAAAIHQMLRDYGEGDYDPGTGNDYGDQTAVVLAVRDREMEQLRAEVARVQERACRTAELLRYAEERVAELEAAITHVRALPQTPQVQVQIYGIAGQEDYNRGWSSAISATRAALDQPKQPTTQQPGCEHCGASVSHLPSQYMKGATVGYCQGELTPKQQPTTMEA